MWNNWTDWWHIEWRGRFPLRSKLLTLLSPSRRPLWNEKFLGSTKVHCGIEKLSTSHVFSSRLQLPLRFTLIAVLSGNHCFAERDFVTRELYSQFLRNHQPPFINSQRALVSLLYSNDANRRYFCNLLKIKTKTPKILTRHRSTRAERVSVRRSL